MVIVGYARVSSIAQAEDSDALKQQIDRLKKAGIEQLYIDIQSGRSDSRKEFNRLIGDVKRGLITEIIVTRIDRLGRTMLSVCKAIEIIKSKNVKLTILDSPIDINNPFGILSFQQMSAMAEFESSLLSQRVQHGQRFFRQQQKIYKACFGYKKNSEGKLEPDNTVVKEGITKWLIAREIINKLLSGESANNCSAYLLAEYGISFCDSSIGKWLNLPALLGHTSYFHQKRAKGGHKELIYDTHIPLLTETEREQIRQNLNKNRCNFQKNTPGNYPLVGLMRCGVCGATMYRQVNSKGIQYARCNRHAKQKELCSNSKCNHLLKIQDFVIVEITRQAKTLIPRILEQSKKEETESQEVRALRGELDELRQIKSSNPIIQNAIANLEVELQHAIARPKHQITVVSDDLLDLINRASYTEFWESLTDDLLKDVFGQLVSSVIVDEFGEILVKLRF
ncbi:resolvase [Calothrix sp. NIES-4101]|nr:resolvase [Calothrix sp. NIES-4101]